MRAVGDAGGTIVFLHGLGASLRYWGRAYDALAERHRLLFVDLLGFGGSPKPPGRYGLSEHCSAIQATLERQGIARATIVGHSAGAVIGLALHHRRPDLAARVIAFGAPIFPSEDAALRHLRSLGLLARLMADESPWAERLCRFLCEHRELGRRLAPLLAPRLPGPVASDGVDHTWDSYHGTFDLLVRQEEMREAMRAATAATVFAYGPRDRTCSPALTRRAAGATPVRVEVAPAGDHHLPLEQPAWCSRLINSFAAGPEAKRGRNTTTQ